jgi:predicted PurR-regulated permease PerM
MLASAAQEILLATTDRFASRVFNLAVVAALGYLLFRIVEPFLGPIFWAVLLALILFPLNQHLRRRLRGRKSLAAVILTLGVTLGIVLPAAAVAVAFARQGVELSHDLTAMAEKYRIAQLQDILHLPIIGNAVAWLQSKFGLDTSRIQEWLATVAASVTQFLLSHGRAFLFGAFGFVGDLTVMLFTLFFCFRDGDEVADRMIRILPFDDRRKDHLFSHIRSVTEAVVLGTIITAIAQGTLVGIAFWITGLPSPVVFGVLTAIASFVPLVGTAIVIGPAAVYLSATEGIWWKGLFMVAWGVLVAGSADNVLKPMLISGRAEIGTLPVFFGVIGGLAAFGMAGLFLGPVLVAIGLVLLQFADETSGTSQGEPGVGLSTPGP